MVTWSSGYQCTDCGREINHAGTCSDCKIANQPVPKKLLDDLKGKKGGRK